jgi:hypothetical protein
MEKEKSMQQTYQIEDNRPILDNELAEIQGAPNDEEYWEEEQQRSRNQKAMLFGALWFIGGLVLTLSNTGAIFYGAIIYGLFQFIRGATGNA